MENSEKRHLPKGIVPLKELVTRGDPSVRLCVEYEKPQPYVVPASIADNKDTQAASAELHRQFVSSRSVSPPGRSITYLKNCVVLPNSAIVTEGGAVILESCFPYADKTRILKMFEPWLFEEEGELFAKTTGMEVISKPVIYLREHGEMGFFHWMHSVFPRVDIIDSQGIPAEFALLIQSKAKFQAESLKLYNISDRELVKPSTTAPQFYQEVIFPSALVEKGDFWLRPPSIKKFYSNLVFDETLSPERVYITRQDAQMRRLTNESAVIDLLKQNDFVSVELARLSFVEQLNLFRQCKIVVGVHGAGLSHVVNMRATSGLLEILHPRRFWATYRALAARSSVHYGFVVGEDPDLTAAGDSFDFEVDLEKLQRVLSLTIEAVS